MILITGGTGLVGSHLLYELCKQGKTVRALKRAGSDAKNVTRVFSYYTPDPTSLLKNIEWVDADLLDIYSLSEAMTGVTEIYHCAAMVSFEKKHEEEMMKINIEGTANMVNAALEKDIRKFCHLSSIASLGTTEHGELITEATFWKSSPDNSKYSTSKYGAEREVWRASEEGLNVVIVNPSLILGPGNWKQSSSNIFSKAYEGIRYYTEGINGFIDVRDVARLSIKLMEGDISNERFILNAANAPFRRFFDLIHENYGKKKPSVKAGKWLSDLAWRTDSIRSVLLGTRPLLTKETARSAHNVRNFSNEKISKAFPEYEFISMEDSVKETCKLFLEDLKTS